MSVYILLLSISIQRLACVRYLLASLYAHIRQKSSTKYLSAEMKAKLARFLINHWPLHASLGRFFLIFVHDRKCEAVEHPIFRCLSF